MALGGRGRGNARPWERAPPCGPSGARARLRRCRAGARGQGQAGLSTRRGAGGRRPGGSARPQGPAFVARQAAAREDPVPHAGRRARAAPPPRAWPRRREAAATERRSGGGTPRSADAPPPPAQARRRPTEPPGLDRRNTTTTQSNSKRVRPASGPPAPAPSVHHIINRLGIPRRFNPLRIRSRSAPMRRRGGASRPGVEVRPVPASPPLPPWPATGACLIPSPPASPPAGPGSPCASPLPDNRQQPPRSLPPCTNYVARATDASFAQCRLPAVQHTRFRIHTAKRLIPKSPRRPIFIWCLSEAYSPVRFFGGASTALPLASPASPICNRVPGRDPGRFAPLHQPPTRLRASPAGDGSTGAGVPSGRTPDTCRPTKRRTDSSS